MPWNENYFRRIFAFSLVVVMLGAPPLSWAGVSYPSKPVESKKDKNKKGTRPLVEIGPAARKYPQLVIGSGDILYIAVYGETGGNMANALNGGSQLMTDYQVDSDGTITFPFLGAVQMAGLTPAQASEKIAGLLHKPRKVTVLIKESNTFWVSVMGNVLKPGKYQIKGSPTLLSTLAQAGGPLPGTDMGGAILIHDNVKTKIDLSRFLEGEGLTGEETYFYPGDTLMVQKSGWPSLGEFAILASILASVAIVTVELGNLR
jgi:protein involved in polysaccharide export with SLBB domain